MRLISEYRELNLISRTLFIKLSVGGAALADMFVTRDRTMLPSLLAGHEERDKGVFRWHTHLERTLIYMYMHARVCERVTSPSRCHRVQGRRSAWGLNQ